jgi:hypothetical protein
MRRIAVIGNAGGGKSVLSRQLGGALGLPVHSLDDLQWAPGWTPVADRRVAAAHAEWLRGPGWIIDGWGSWELIEARFDAADTIVIIDLPFRVHVRWVLKRQAAAMLGLSPHWPPPGCAAGPVTRRLLELMRDVDERMLPRLRTLAAEPRFAGRVVHLRSPAELRAWRGRVVGDAGPAS